MSVRRSADRSSTNEDRLLIAESYIDSAGPPWQREPRPERAARGVEPGRRPERSPKRWDRRTLRLLLALSASPVEWVTTLGEMTRARSDGYRLPVLLDGLVKLTHERNAAAARLGAMFETRLAAAAAPFAELSFFELASLWARRRESMSGKAMAALLWRIARDPSPIFRQLEERLVADIEILGLRALGAGAYAAGRNQAGPADSGKPSPSWRSEQ